MSARRWGTVVAAGSAIATVAAIAIATHAPVADPNDTRGPLDVRRVRLIHDAGPPTWTVLTFQGWTTRAVWDRGHVFLFVDTIGTPDGDYFMHVRSTGSRLVGSLWRVARNDGARDRRLRSVQTWRDSGNGVSVRLPLWAVNIGPARTSFRWWLFTSYLSSRCRTTCLDRAPDSGSVIQWLPGSSPTPSPTGPTGPTGA